MTGRIETVFANAPKNANRGTLGYLSPLAIQMPQPHQPLLDARC